MEELVCYLMFAVAALDGQDLIAQHVILILNVANKHMHVHMYIHIVY